MKKTRAVRIKRNKSHEVAPMGWRRVRFRCELPRPEVVYAASDLPKHTQLVVRALHSVIHLLDRRSFPTA